MNATNLNSIAITILAVGQLLHTLFHMEDKPCCDDCKNTNEWGDIQGCRHSCHSQDNWREELKRQFDRAYVLNARDGKMLSQDFIIDFIATEKQKSYQEGVVAGRNAAVDYILGHENCEKDELPDNSALYVVADFVFEAARTTP